VRSLNEPTAASLAYGFGKDTHECDRRLDLGGGTFDISILESATASTRSKSTAGDTLSWRDFDARVMEYLLDQFKQDTGLDLSEDMMAIQRIKEAAEAAKCDLSTNEVTRDLRCVHRGRPHRAEASPGPSHPEPARGLVRGSRGADPRAVSEPLEAARVDASRSTRLDPGRRPDRDADGRPAVSESSGDAVPGHHPDEVRGHRCGAPGGIPAGRGSRTSSCSTSRRCRSASRPTAVCSQDHRAQLDHSDQEVHDLSPRSPTNQTTSRSTSSRRARHRGENRSFGRFDLVVHPAVAARRAADRGDLLDRLQRHRPRWCRDLATGKEQGIEVQPAGGLSKIEIDGLIAEADKYRSEDERRRTVRQLQNRLEGLLYTKPSEWCGVRNSLSPDDRESVRATLNSRPQGDHHEERTRARGGDRCAFRMCRRS